MKDRAAHVGKIVAAARRDGRWHGLGRARLLGNPGQGGAGFRDGRGRC